MCSTAFAPASASSKALSGVFEHRRSRGPTLLPLRGGPLRPLRMPHSPGKTSLGRCASFRIPPEIRDPHQLTPKSGATCSVKQAASSPAPCSSRSILSTSAFTLPLVQGITCAIPARSLKREHRAPPAPPCRYFPARGGRRRFARISRIAAPPCSQRRPELPGHFSCLRGSRRAKKKKSSRGRPRGPWRCNRNWVALGSPMRRPPRPGHGRPAAG